MMYDLLNSEILITLSDLHGHAPAASLVIIDTVVLQLTRYQLT